MKLIKFSYEGTPCEVDFDRANAALTTLKEKSGAGSTFTGWVDYPLRYDKEEYARMKSAARIVRERDALVVVGIGGSYLGTRAVLEALRGPHGPEIYFAGESLSSDALYELMEKLEGKDYAVNVVSKSGTTTEPAIAFRLLRADLMRRHGEKAKDYIYATTDRARGALKSLATKEGYETFTIPDDIGGRYSVFTPVGLFPLMVAGIDTDKLLEGAACAMELLTPSRDNVAMRYAMTRQALYADIEKKIELFVTYDESMRMVAEWWKQLYGESEGKDGKGLFPASAVFTTDLHSLGQMIQEGERNLFETVVRFEKANRHVSIPDDPEDLDGLNYLAGKTLETITARAAAGVKRAHLAGGVPQLEITLERKDEKSLGYLLYFFMLACGISAYMSGVNPFDQPGVEAYKKSMFRELGKPGYEA